MKGRRHREGTLAHSELTPEGRDEIDPDALGTLEGLHGFLEKAKRLPQLVDAPEGSLREWYVRQIQYLTSEVELFLARVPAAERGAVERDTVEPGVVGPTADGAVVVEPAVVEPAVVEPAVIEPAVIKPAVVEPAIDRAAVERALVYALHAGANFAALMAELRADALAGGRRARYLQARAQVMKAKKASHRSRKNLARLAGFNSVQAMTRFEDAQGLPRPRRKARS